MLVTEPPARELLNALVSRHFAGRRVALLEAGGGSTTKLDLAALDIADITTIDISPEQLEANDYADFKILADLQTYAPERRYDLVVIYNVLEHIPRADHAMERLAEACAQDGLLVVGSPYMRSLSGLVTRLTPHAAHVFFYRHVLGQREAGQPGNPPFPTHFHPMTLPGNLVDFLERRGYRCEFRALLEGGVYAEMTRRRPALGYPLKLATMLVNALTPKSYNTRYGNFYLIFRKVAVD